MLEVVGERVGLDPARPRDVVAALVARTPLGAALAEEPALREHIDHGLLNGAPSGEHAPQLLRAAAGTLPEREQTEGEVTAALARVGHDPVALRRALVDTGLLWRTEDRARYRRTEQPPESAPSGGVPTVVP